MARMVLFAAVIAGVVGASVSGAVDERGVVFSVDFVRVGYCAFIVRDESTIKMIRDREQKMCQKDFFVIFMPCDRLLKRWKTYSLDHGRMLGIKSRNESCKHLLIIHNVVI